MLGAICRSSSEINKFMIKFWKVKNQNRQARRQFIATYAMCGRALLLRSKSKVLYKEKFYNQL